MKKAIITIALLAGLANAYGWTLVHCKYDYSYNSMGGPYVGLYKNLSGEVVRMAFHSWCPSYL